jgi:hypothetical protein
MTSNDYILQANEILEISLSAKNSEKWDFVLEKEGTILKKKSLPEICSFPCYLAETTINKPRDKVVEKLWNIDESGAKKNDPKLSSWVEIEKKDNWKVCSQYNKMGWPIWDRHTVFAQVKIEKNNIIYLVAFSIEHPNAMPDNSKFITNKLHLSVYEYIDNGNNTTNISRITLVDPKGSIPQWIVELFSGNMVNMLNLWKHD